jgi:hypothetical protein
MLYRGGSGGQVSEGKMEALKNENARLTRALESCEIISKALRESNMAIRKDGYEMMSKITDLEWQVEKLKQDLALSKIDESERAKS